MNNRYKGKKFSILGDSISTLEGYNPKGYNVFYKDETCSRAGVKVMADTWWGKVIDYFDGKLLVNNSWSGSRVTKLPSGNKLFPAGCSDERTSGLHEKAVMPDVIIVYLGTNDWAFGAAPGYADYLCQEITSEAGKFDWAYNRMLVKIKANYPHAEVWCCTLSPAMISSKPSFEFPYEYAGIHMEIYNAIIREAVRRNGFKLIDLYAHGKPYDSLDGSHPTAKGMDVLAQTVIRELDKSKPKGIWIDATACSGAPGAGCLPRGKYTYPR